MRPIAIIDRNRLSELRAMDSFLTYMTPDQTLGFGAGSIPAEGALSAIACTRVVVSGRGAGYNREMSDVTEILSKIEAGDAKAADGLLPLVYEQLRELAASRMLNERPDHTLQGTALVHEAYLRLVGSPGGQSWENRGHFFAAAAEAMRRILVDSARAKKSQKHGGDRQRIELDDFIGNDPENADMLLDLDEGLSQLALEDAASAELVKLRLFAGLSVTEAGQVLGISRSTAYENWGFARSWFAMYLGKPLP